MHSGHELVPQTTVLDFSLLFILLQRLILAQFLEF